MLIFNIHEAKTHLSQLISRVEKGEEVIIGRAGKPIAKIVTYHPQVKARKPGFLRGKIKIHKDFDQLPPELLNAFKGEKE